MTRNPLPILNPLPERLRRPGPFGRPRLRTAAAISILLATLAVTTTAQEGDDVLPSRPPNILWLTAEDLSPTLGAYGDTFAHTPHLDAFAEIAMRYDVVWSSSPVCSPARTAILMGMYPTSLGGHNHRSEVGLSPLLRTYPELIREHGYYATNNAKEDYNVVAADGNREVWDDSSDRAHYRNRPDENTPFLAVFNNLDSHGSRVRRRTELPHHDPAQVTLPPFHPDAPQMRRDWAQHYHSITVMDEWFGRKLQEARDDGLFENTVIFFYGDHGAGMPRYKQLAYNTGLLTPMLVYFPEKYRHLAPEDYRPGGVTRRPVEFVDLAPTLLSLSGVRPPEWMQGHAFLGRFEEEPRRYVFGARGRMDERKDMVRSVRDDRYVYIRNYLPHLEHGHFSRYKYTFESTREWRELFRAGRLQPPETHVWEPKPPEELFDLRADPYEVNNLVDSPHHQDVLDRMRSAHRRHMIETRDVQFLPEAEMHRRAKGTTAPLWEIPGREAASIYEMAQDPQRYPIERILAMAELAAARSFEAVPMLQVGLQDEDPAVRYWAAMGVLIRGSRAVEVAIESVRKAMEDRNPSVQVVAAEILAFYGDEEDRERALNRLLGLSRPDQYGVYVTIEALNAVQNLGEIAAPIRGALLENAKEDPQAPWRGANEFIERLLPEFVHPDLAVGRLP